MITLPKELETGVAKIDSQHRELIDRLNAVTSMGMQAVTKEETLKTLDLLGNYIMRHFTDEEVLLMQCKYPKLEWHKEQHRLYFIEFIKLKKNFAASGHSPKYTLELTNSIINWIVRHIKTVDVDMGRHLRSAGMA